MLRVREARESSRHTTKSTQAKRIQQQNLGDESRSRDGPKEGKVKTKLGRSVEAFAAPARARSIRIVENEFALELRIDVVHLGANDGQQCLGCHGDRHAVRLDDLVAFWHF